MRIQSEFFLPQLFSLQMFRMSGVQCISTGENYSLRLCDGNLYRIRMKYELSSRLSAKIPFNVCFLWLVSCKFLLSMKWLNKIFCLSNSRELGTGLTCSACTTQIGIAFSHCQVTWTLFGVTLCLTTTSWKTILTWVEKKRDHMGQREVTYVTQSPQRSYRGQRDD